ncbi:MAG: trypsin-like peptidase domain-containing protein [Deltaproteobacteria bacterium]|nr:MAG: trypsin-like peptidase domain-containing protein [Deltaproteobacteria bacterium]
MSRPFAVLLLASAASLSARAAVVVSPDPQTEFKSVADRLHSTVIVVRARAAVAVPTGNDAEGIMQTPSFGTGVLIGDGLAITTLHTVGAVLPGRMAAWTEIEALLQDSAPVGAKIIGWFPELDLAVLRLAETPSTAPVALASEVPATGERLLAMGADDDVVSVVGVTLAAARGDQLILTSARRVDSRYWGGPIFDIHGRLVGITVPSVTPKAVSALAIGALLERIRAQ